MLQLFIVLCVISAIVCVGTALVLKRKQKPVVESRRSGFRPGQRVAVMKLDYSGNLTGKIHCYGHVQRVLERDKVRVLQDNGSTVDRSERRIIAVGS